MARRHEKTTAERIFENILFLEEVFGDKAEVCVPTPVCHTNDPYVMSPCAARTPD